jgi:hypothetical protein
MGTIFSGCTPLYTRLAVLWTQQPDNQKPVSSGMPHGMPFFFGPVHALNPSGQRACGSHS